MRAALLGVAAMSIEEDIKQAELHLKQLEIEQKQAELNSKSYRFGLSSAAVVITIVGGLSAIIFQALGIHQANIQAATAEKDRGTALGVAQLQTQKDFDSKGVELFLRERERLITCDTEATTRNLKLFKGLFTEQITASFSEVVGYTNQTCATQAANAVAEKARRASKSEDQVKAAADSARYNTIEQRTATLGSLIAPVVSPQPSIARDTVFIQINTEDDRPNARTLQAALIREGYSAPGIELASVAPSAYEVRYYYRVQQDEAAKLAAFAASVLRIDSASIKPVGPLESTYKSLPGKTMEFWFRRRH
jgi:hypothetical protein